METLKKSIFFLLILLLASNFYGQVSETYFSDMEGKYGGRISCYVKGEDFIIIGGKSFDAYKNQPSVTKIDTLGNVLWTTTNQDSSLTTGNMYRLIRSGDFLYGTTTEKEIWKIDIQTGATIWRKDFPSLYSSPDRLIDFDTNKILVGYVNGYNGSFYKARYAFVDKSTGDTLSTRKLGDLAWKRRNYGLAIDSEKNIYYTEHDSIFKVKGSNPDSLIWGVQHPSAELADIRHIHIDGQDKIFLFGSKLASSNRGKALSIDKSNGSLIWDQAQAFGAISFRMSLEKDNNIYAIWTPNLVGSGGSNMFITRYNKSTGTLNLSTSYAFQGVPLGSAIGNSGALSLDVDSGGDVFVTGFYGDDNYGPENWGILKLDGNSGTVLYERTITEDSLYTDKASSGIVACVINDQPYILGDLQTSFESYYGKAKVAFIKMDNSSGNILEKKIYQGSYQFAAQTLEIENYGQNKTVVYKQVGRSVVVEMYDYSKNLLWQRSISKEYMLKGTDLVVGHEGSILVGATLAQDSDTDPFYDSTPDSMLVFGIDSLGNVFREDGFEADSYFFQARQLLFDRNGETFVFYCDGGNVEKFVYMRKIDLNGMISEPKIISFCSDLLPNSQNLFDYSDSTFMFFGDVPYNIGRFNFGTDRKAYEINKNRLSASSYSNFNYLNKINFALQKSTDEFFFCGQDTEGHGFLAAYNTLTRDTIWTNTSSFESEAILMTFNEDSTAIYTADTTLSDLIVRKINVSNGQEEWAYVSAGTATRKERPLDIVYNNARKQIIVSGYLVDRMVSEWDQQVFIDIIDSTGSKVNSIIKYGDFSGNNAASCVAKLADGSIWVGGNLNHSTHGKAGFIFELNPSSMVSIEQELIDTPTMNLRGFPNPFKNHVNLGCTISKNDSQIGIDIYSIDGKKVFTHHEKHVPAGDYQLKISKLNQPGLYVVKVSINSTLSSLKIMRMD